MEGTFLVMENLRYAHPCNHVFDLKGSMRNRFVRMDDSDLENVYQDENFLQCKIYIMYTCIRKYFVVTIFMKRNGIFILS